MAEQEPSNNNQPEKKPLTEDDIKEEPTSQGNNKTLKIVLIVIGVLVLLSVAAFAAIGWAGKTFFDRVTDEYVETDNGSIRIGDEESGVEISGSEELAEDFPAQVPIYEPSDLQSSSRFRQNEDVVWSAGFGTSSSQEEVAAYYETMLAQDGWEIANVFETDDMTSISAVNESAELNIQLMVTQGTEATTEFTMTVSSSPDEQF